MGVGYPLKIPYIIGHTVHRQGHFPRRQAAGNDRLRESRGNGWHTDFGTKSSVLYPSRRGTGEITNWPQPVRDFDRTEKEEREVSVSTPLGRTFSESRGGDFPLPRPQTTTKENIFSAVVHMDEKTPHMHLCFVPLTKDKRLSAKEILGNKKAMIRWQDDFYACMSERWPELERGTPAVETKRRHLTPQWYKRVTAMDTKLEKLETALNGINVLNAGKKREEAVALLAQLLPEVESFQAEIQRMQQAVSRSLTMQRCSAEENETLKDELTAERRKSAEQRAKLTVLEERYKRAEKLLKRLPLELTERVEDKEKSQER